MKIRNLGNNKHQIDFYPAGGKGKRERITFVGTEAQATRHGLQLMKLFNAEDITGDPTYSTLMSEFLPYYEVESSPTTVENLLIVYGHVLEPHFGAFRISQITPMVIEQFKLKRRQAKVKKRTINKELSYFLAPIKWGAKVHKCSTLPFHVERYDDSETKPPKPVVPLKEPLRKLLEALDHPDKRGLFILMYHGGLRKGEANTIRGENVHLDRDYMLVTGKGNKQRIVPIETDTLREELTLRKEKMGKGYLYINPRTNRPYIDVSDYIKARAKEVGISLRIYNHLLRHSFVTHNIEAGVNMRAVQLMAGHASMKTTEGYTHLTADFVKDEGKKFGEYIDKNDRSQPVITNNANPE